ncbi:hypothetical protein [Amycolatopsis taiwanensis]|uniref:hypothetical protein n=1 Tax=Amycolatopsis taiwanensis TaxID=342230 RepID=UPI0025560A9F|nr:hypothetical protein [Amycolatopsis taiwanensis]
MTRSFWSFIPGLLQLSVNQTVQVINAGRESSSETDRVMRGNMRNLPFEADFLAVYGTAFPYTT